MTTNRVEHEKEIFVVWANTDLTEGRGYQIPIGWSDSHTAATRISKGRGVMGSDAEVKKFTAINRGGHWLAPVVLEKPNAKDQALDKKRLERIEAVNKARTLGLTSSDLKALGVEP